LEENGLYMRRGNHYVEILTDFRGFLLTVSGLVIILAGLTCFYAWSHWRYQQVLHELWKRLPQSKE
jgi:hypothetical protein